MKPGDLITIEGVAYKVDGKILEYKAVDDLPKIMSAPQVEIVKKILNEWLVSHVAIFLFEDKCFAALLTAKGWRDMKGQHLTITQKEEA